MRLTVASKVSFVMASVLLDQFGRLDGEGVVERLLRFADCNLGAGQSGPNVIERLGLVRVGDFAGHVVIELAL